MGGKEVKAKEIVQYYKSYMEIFKGNTMPEPKSMLEVSCEYLYIMKLNLHRLTLIFSGDNRGQQLGEPCISQGALHG